MPDSPVAHLPLEPLLDDWTAIGVVALIKCIDRDGSESWSFRTSEDLNDEEVLGALTVRTEMAKAWLVEQHVWTAVPEDS